MSPIINIIIIIIIIIIIGDTPVKVQRAEEKGKGLYSYTVEAEVIV